MQSHPETIGVAHKIAIVMLAGILFGSWALRSEEPDSVTIKIHRSDGKVALYRSYPERVVKVLFPKGEAIIGPDESPGKTLTAPTSILKKIQIVEVSDTERRFKVAGVIFGDELFIFDDVFSDNDPATMSQLMRATAYRPQGEKEALDLATLYLALAHYRLADVDRIVAYKNSDSANKSDLRNYVEAPDVPGVAHSPVFVQEKGTYAVDFYAYDEPDEPAKGVSHWKIELGPNGLEERLSAHHDQFRPFYARATSEWTQPPGKVIFAPVMMGNGFSDDGATTDLQSWGSTDGPGFSRVHYYYNSHELAEKRVQEYLHNAVVVIDSGPWLDSKGQSVGTETILIRTNDAQKSLFASNIREDATTVLEISCSSLGNLLRAVNRELRDRPH